MLRNLLSVRPWPGQLNKTGLAGLDWLGSLGCLGWPGLADWLAVQAIWDGWDGRLAGNMKDFCVFGFEFIRPDFFLAPDRNKNSS